MNITESLLKMVEITKENLTLLQAIKESFHTKDLHIQTTYDGERFIIPSYISLEAKINHLQDGFDSLVHASKMGAAWLNYDGDSRTIYVQGHDASPSPITINLPEQFDVEEVDLFKDMLSPKPYINFNLDNLPDNINKVRVKKLIPFADNLKEVLANEVGKPLSYPSLMKTIKSLKLVDGRDYMEYDTTYDLPISSSIGVGSYIIKSLVDDWVDDKLDQHVRIQLDTTLYTDINLLDKELTVGCQLATHDYSCIMEITAIGDNGLLECKVLHGSYCHITEDYAGTDYVSDSSRLVFYKASIQDRVIKDKSIHIPLEEDRYVYIAVSPINTQVNLMAFWNSGIYIDTHQLKDKDNKTSFKEYYDNHVRNVGDILNELVGSAGTPLSSITFDTGIKPELNMDNFKVVQINKHLNNAKAVQDIRAQYSLKKQYQLEYSDVQNKLTTLKDAVAKLNFDDTTGTRSMYMAQIHDLQNRQTELLSYINKAIESISISATDSAIPIADAKFHVRGYFDIEKLILDSGGTIKLNDIYGIQVLYRYRNKEIPTSTSTDINGYIYSEWQTIYSVPLEKTMSYKDGTYTISTPDISSANWKGENNIKFNQIGIPIVQGEVVDIKARILWAYGLPNTTNYSNWSDMVTIEFPVELIKDVELKTIISENNSDIETSRFNNILHDKGLIAHIAHESMDQNVKYYHEANDVMSGFYTSERRVIPLGDKLAEMNAKLDEMKALVYGTSSTNIQVSMQFDSVDYVLSPNITNEIHLPAYSTIKGGGVMTGAAQKLDNGFVIMVGTLNIKNVSNQTSFLYSIFPGRRDASIKDIYAVRGDVRESMYDSTLVIRTKTPNSNKFTKAKPLCNQFIYQNLNDIYTRLPLHEANVMDDLYKVYINVANVEMEDQDKMDVTGKDDILYAIMSPNKAQDIQIVSDDVNTKLSIPAGEAISVPITVIYKTTGDVGGQASYSMAFDIRNSLYNDPIQFVIKMNAKNRPEPQDVLNSKKNTISSSITYNPTVR